MVIQLITLQYACYWSCCKLWQTIPRPLFIFGRVKSSNFINVIGIVLLSRISSGLLNGYIVVLTPLEKIAKPQYLKHSEGEDGKAIGDLLFSPDGRFLVSHAYKGRLIVWFTKVTFRVFYILVGSAISNPYLGQEVLQFIFFHKNIHEFQTWESIYILSIGSAFKWVDWDATSRKLAMYTASQRIAVSNRNLYIIQLMWQLTLCLSFKI